MHFDEKVVLIVGASSGIGRILALRLASEGERVVITARRKDRLDKVADDIVRIGGHCVAYAADAESPHAAEHVVNTCLQLHGRIDILILNAGGAPAIDMRAMRAHQVNAYMRSNYDVAVNYLFPVLQQMRHQTKGMVVQTNSLAGFLGVPLQGPYSAAKGALRLLIDACRVEFGHLGIKFVSVYPGFIATEATIGDGMPAPLEMSEDKAVDHILAAMRRQRADTMFPWQMGLLVRLSLALPKAIVTRMLRRDVPPVPFGTRHTDIS
ncbi:SDR family NAD(P)-dependent oxidoreductase [Robbsia andropogonis]|uniref:SDR family NAD(P)-dependent oxidoreductase n=1 Tax=Robbsia andropogonis TaxID=28092 RepID=UPI00209E7EEE|nr:SDR family NAD(P)-dependent oxidoreductase [Robbsia andropogonis]MCP1118257.1 SDR family NAD(P)-dependent oxidoreductase [Robbsia andropogonis]MCP1127462.1 SDR family NAD(P)-dependent oxidoreductase [Robbsia andropogonis]